jgi:uncharacterized membrane protein
MKWIVVSPRVGKPGAEYDIEGAAANGINVAGLIAGGFIKAAEESTTKPTKPRKVKTDTKE